MNIKARIIGRKVTLVYLYQRLFVQESISNQDLTRDLSDKETGEVKFVDGDEVLKTLLKGAKDQDTELTNKETISKIRGFYEDETFFDDIDYIIESGFSRYKKKDLIDIDYIKSVGSAYSDYKDKVAEQVDKHASSFHYDEMDEIDKAIFLLGYIESQELNTPKKVLINEMIELAKRYGDPSSFKLINAIGDKII